MCNAPLCLDACMCSMACCRRALAACQAKFSLKAYASNAYTSYTYFRKCDRQVLSSVFTASTWFTVGTGCSACRALADAETTTNENPSLGLKRQEKAHHCIANFRNCFLISSSVASACDGQFCQSIRRELHRLGPSLIPPVTAQSFRKHTVTPRTSRACSSFMLLSPDQQD